MRRDDNTTDDLLAAYVDGVSELSPDERRRVEARLRAPDAGLRADEAATRELIGQLRELPAAHAEPDWSALERSIHDEVGPSVPRTWWRGWRWAIPAMALVATASIIVIVMQRPEPVVEAPVAITPPRAPEHVAPVPSTDTVALWLDGREIEVGLDEADGLLDDPMLGLDEPALLGSSGGLLEPSDLAWAIDELDDEALGRAEHALEHPHHRKKS
jgi:hypothetical protein